MILDECEIKKEVIFLDNEKYLSVLDFWQKKLNLQDWDIHFLPVDQPWRKSGDIKIDDSNKNAVLMLNVKDAKRLNSEEVIVHELLHLKLWPLDQMIEELINLLYGSDENDKQRDFVYSIFMSNLESTVQDLTKSLVSLKEDDFISELGRLKDEVKKETGIDDHNIIKRR